MSYQPRRVAEVIVDTAAEETDSVVEETPRRAATSLVDKLFHRGGGLAAGVTVAATAVVVAIGATSGAASAVGVPVAAAAPVPSQQLIADQLVLVRPASVAMKATSKVTAVAVSRQFTEGSLNVRSEPSREADLLGRVGMATQVKATSEVEGEYRKIVYEDGYGWVLNDELSDSTEASVPEGTSMAPCSRGSKVENRLRKTTIFIYRSVCPLFPELNSVGGWRAGGMAFHKNGRALDLMLTPGKESALGWRITKYLIAHRVEFKIDHIIFEQQIWTPSSGHWKKMADRGSINANHFNHVHVAVTSSAG